jgi:predicted DNA-binding protein
MGSDEIDSRQLERMTVDQVIELMTNMVPAPVATREEEEAILATLPTVDPDAPIQVVSSLRMSLDLKQRLDAAADAEGISTSAFIRRAVESALAGRHRTNLVNIEDVIRAIRAVPPAAA